MTLLSERTERTIMEQDKPLTNDFLQQAADVFQRRCITNPPLLRDSFDIAVEVAKQISNTITSTQALDLLHENPNWVETTAGMPGRPSVREIVAEQLAFALRGHIDTHWITLLCMEKRSSPDIEKPHTRETERHSDKCDA